LLLVCRRLADFRRPIREALLPQRDLIGGLGNQLIVRPVIELFEIVAACGQLMIASVVMGLTIYVTKLVEFLK
jgi:hypothetical protein